MNSADGRGGEAAWAPLTLMGAGFCPGAGGGAPPADGERPTVLPKARGEVWSFPDQLATTVEL